MSPVGEVFNYLANAAHLVYLFSVECLNAVVHLPYSYAGNEYILFSWLAYCVFFALDYFCKPTNIFTAFAKKGIFRVGSAVFAVAYLYLAYFLLLFVWEEGLSWSTNYKALSDEVGGSRLFWYFWILKLSCVFWKRLMGDTRSKKGVFLLMFWFVNLKYEELAQPQLVVLLFLDCLRSSSLLLLVDAAAMDNYVIGFNWFFETVESYIFLSAYTAASRYPMFAFVNMALFNPYSMILIFFLGTISFKYWF